MARTVTRAYALIETKSVDAERRVIEGIASTPSTDRHGDVVEPLGATFKLPLPLLWQHRADEPIGHVEWAQPNAKGIPFRARFVKVEEPGPLKDRLDMAWQSVKSGLVRACSIGFVPLEAEPIATGYRFSKWNWTELSAVTIPANVDATIANAKHFDEQVRSSGGAIRTITPRFGRPLSKAVMQTFDDRSGENVDRHRLAAAMIGSLCREADHQLAALNARIEALEAHNQ